MNSIISSTVNSIIYRQIFPFEVEAVSLLAGEAFDQFVAPHYSAEGVIEFHRYASAEALSERHQSGYLTLVAEQVGELAGMLHLRKPHHISMFFVRSSSQRSGIARGLLAAVSALIGEKDGELTVNASPNAVFAYQQLGFCVTGVEQCRRGIRFKPMQRLLTISRPA